MSVQDFVDRLRKRFPRQFEATIVENNEVTIEVSLKKLHTICEALRDEEEFAFTQLMDLCVVDYLTYGCDQWTTDEATLTGFSRGVDRTHTQSTWQKPRFAVVYHLLSTTHNERLRVRTFVQDQYLIVPTAIGIWASAAWYEREAFDLFGILFDGHPDLRRILTDYGFIGHPFRKDFPLSGHVEVRYSPEQRRVVYQPVTIEPRILVPKVIRDDHRYT